MCCKIDRINKSWGLAVIPLALLLPRLRRLLLPSYSLYSGLNCDVYLEECPKVGPTPFQMEVKEHGSPPISPDQLPMWDLGFSRLCCDVHPRTYVPLCAWMAFIGEDRCNVRESAEPIREFTWGLVDYRNEIARMSEPGAIVYVTRGAMQDFLDAFAQLPSTASLILVTGNGDCGMPREQWGEGLRQRGNPGCFLIHDWKDMRTRMHYKELIQDPRLRHWFAQNYDLTGCTPHSGCSSWSRDQAWTHKITPIPIGLGVFERYAEEFFWIPAHERKSMRKQLLDLLDVRVRLHRFDLKRRKLLLAFGRSHLHKRRLLDSLTGQPYVEHYATQEWHLEPGTYSDRLAYWQGLGEHMFVAAPYGSGMDTYRLWEALFLGSIPVVESSSLDLLYRDLPVIIIESWESINETSLSHWQSQIIQRFGSEPLTQVQEKLTMRYWLDVVQQAANRSKLRSPLDLGQDNEACNSPVVHYCSDPW
mmetsp:Transcript_22348/g.63401  ORF Transcript_22348/g.63401 Transcript_22348/m.63401 type:complete len:475 (+) Transcript_22348:54-1478(+)